MRERLNPRGYTWQKYLRTLWWRLLLTAGIVIVAWRGSNREQFWYIAAVLAIVFADMGRDAWRALRRP